MELYSGIQIWNRINPTWRASGLAVALFVLTFCPEVPAYAQQPQLADTVSFNGMPAPLLMRYIPAGTFLMGSPASGDPDRAHEEPARRVSVQAFYMGAYEVTWEQYNAFFSDAGYTVNTDADAVTRPSPPYLDFTLGMGKEGFPASSMQQFGALMFCRWLYEKTGKFYRLPTEAEWEYACRAGASTRYPFGDDSAQLDKYAWYAANSGGKYQPVGKLQPNAWGLYDMLGNVAEWTLDEYDEAYLERLEDGAQDPLVMPSRRHPRTVRGGHYLDDAETLRPAARGPSQAVWNRRDPQIPKSKWWNADAPFVGFRVVRPVQQPSREEAEAFFARHLFR